MSDSIKLEIRVMHPRTREKRLRQAARRLGLRLEKSPARDLQDSTFGGYMLVYMERNAVAYVAAGRRGRWYSLTLDGVEAYLKRSEKLLKKLSVNAGSDPAFDHPTQ